MELYYFLLVVVVASVLQGITGFGSALIAAPLLLLFIDKTTSVVSLSFISIALNAFLFATIRRTVDRKMFYTLFFASLTGLPIGIVVLTVFDVHVLRVIAGLLSILFAAFLFSKKLEVRNSKQATLFSGWFSGVLHSSIGIGGPPVVLLLASQNTNKDEMRKTLSLFFLGMSVFSIILFFLSHNLTHKSLMFGLYGIPAAFLGGYIGNIVSKKVSQKQFIWSVFVLVAATIIVALYSGFAR
jgi:uncharacterized membrane protein YfcA